LIDFLLLNRKETPDNFQAFLEHQWNQSAQFVTSKAQHFDGNNISRSS